MAQSKGMHGYNTRVFFRAPYTGSGAAPQAAGDLAAILGPNAPDGKPASPAARGWTELIEAVSVSGAPNTQAITRLTHLTSPRRAVEKTPGFADPGDLSVRVNWTSDTAKLVYESLTLQGVVCGREYQHWMVKYPCNDLMVVNGFVTSYPFDIPEDDRMTFDLTVALTGPPAYYHGAEWFAALRDGGGQPGAPFLSF